MQGAVQTQRCDREPQFYFARLITLVSSMQQLPLKKMFPLKPHCGSVITAQQQRGQALQDSRDWLAGTVTNIMSGLFMSWSGNCAGIRATGPSVSASTAQLSWAEVAGLGFLHHLVLYYCMDHHVVWWRGQEKYPPNIKQILRSCYSSHSPV